MTPQLSLALGFRPSFQLDDFLFGDNQSLPAALHDSLVNDQQPLIYISGSTCSGRSHLLIGQCEAAETLGLSSIYIPLKQKDDFSPEMLDGLANYDLVAIDDVDAIAGDETWELAIFHLFNQLRDANKRLIVSANSGSASVPIKLPDLATRLRWGLAYHLMEFNDEQQQQLAIQLAKRKGMTLSQETARYLLQHYQRHNKKLIEHLDILDKASLQAQRKITIPFIRKILG